jgi:diguanylate cyclase (GGDEF)-like protein
MAAEQPCSSLPRHPDPALTPQQMRHIPFLRLLPARWRIGRPSWDGKVLPLMVCVFVTLLGMDAWQLWHVYDDSIERTGIVTSNMARSIAELAEATVKTGDTLTASLVENVETEGTGPESLTRIYRLMTRLSEALPAIHEMGILNERGDAIVKSRVRGPHGINYADRGYFRFHATHPDRGPFVGAPVTSRIDGSVNITITRRIDHLDGSFAGVAVASVSMTFFQTLFEQVQAKSGGIVGLIADDSTILVRTPPIPLNADGTTPLFLLALSRQAASTGTVDYVSGIDGVRRLGSYDHLREYPLTAFVSQSRQGALSGWRAEVHEHAIILVCIMIVVAILGSRVAKANRALKELAMQDGLTGLASRRFFDQTIEQEFRRAARQGRPLSLIMIDLDHFKDYNDDLGHPAGDECLRAVGRVVQGCLRRPGDVAARYGGEEFAVILPDTDAASACALAETMRQAARALALKHARSRLGVVTLSAGVASIAPRPGNPGWQILVQQADDALYAAKAGGRDMVKLYDPSPARIGATSAAA